MPWNNALCYRAGSIHAVIETNGLKNEPFVRVVYKNPDNHNAEP